MRSCGLSAQRQHSGPRDKRVWAAAVPVGGLAALKEQTTFIGHFGIAVQGQAMSVLFFSDRPFREFSAPLTVGLTGESASSVRLLYLLLGYQNGFDAMPCLVPKGADSNGYLVIGDRALRWAQEYSETGAVRGYAHVTDLAEQWYQRFELPFVFARWVVHVDAPASLKTALHQWLQHYAQEENYLIEKATPKVAERLDLPLAYAQQYLKVIRRCLTHEDEAGQERFLSELKIHCAETIFPRIEDFGNC